MPPAGPIAVVIPAHNEGSRLPAVLASLAAVSMPTAALPPIVVDDGSTDDTGLRATTAGAIVLRHEVKSGKGTALLAGCLEATRRGAAIVAVMDADGQHRPEDVPALVAPILAGEADVVLGRRGFAGDMPLLYRLGNRLLSAVFATFYRLPVDDTQCGMRAFTAAALAEIRWASAGYAVETEMLVRVARARLRWVQRPIPALYLDRRKGTQPSDGLVILGKLLRWRLTGPPPLPPLPRDASAQLGA